MISLWITRHFGLDTYIAEPGDATAGYDTYTNFGVGVWFTWGW